MKEFNLNKLITNNQARRSIDKVLLFNSLLKKDSRTKLENQNQFPSLEFFESLKKSQDINSSIALFQKEFINLVIKSNKLSNTAKKPLLDALFADVTYNSEIKSLKVVSAYTLCISSGFILALLVMNASFEKTHFNTKIFLAVSFMLPIFAISAVLCNMHDNTLTDEEADSFIDWINNLAENLRDDLSNDLLASNVPEGVAKVTAHNSSPSYNSKVNLFMSCMQDLYIQHNNKLLGQRFVNNPELRESLEEILLFIEENNLAQTEKLESAAEIFLDLKYNFNYHSKMKSLLNHSVQALRNSDFSTESKNELLDTILRYDHQLELGTSKLRDWIVLFSSKLKLQYDQQTDRDYVPVATAKMV